MTKGGVINRPFKETLAYSLRVDTRRSQCIDPIRLPAKLQDRIERTQRRANAANNKRVSILTPDAENLKALRLTEAEIQSFTASAAEVATVGALSDSGELQSVSTTNSGADMKLHLPHVVLSHKLGDFEARANAEFFYSVASVDRSMQRLSLIDRERVVMTMQNKIQQIASDVDTNFERLKKTLDANGIFDSEINIQRSQTLCLVDLQRRCKLDRLRDEAMREVLQFPSSSQTRATKPSHKLNLPSSQARNNDSEALPTTETQLPPRMIRTPNTPNLPVLCHVYDHPSEKTMKSKTNGDKCSPLSFQQEIATNKSRTGPMDKCRGTVTPLLHELSPSREVQQRRHNSLTLAVSVSEAALPLPIAMGNSSDAKPSSRATYSRLRCGARILGLRRKLVSKIFSRHRRRKNYVIGASHVDFESKAAGRYSEARIAYRRQSAQTWAWLASSHPAIGRADDSRVDKDGKCCEKNDRLDGEGSTDRDDNDDSLEKLDEMTKDVESDMDRSRISSSARSTVSVNRELTIDNSLRRPSYESSCSIRNDMTSHGSDLQARLEVIWRVLQISFSNKLMMLERLSSLQDANAFLSALELWEQVALIVSIRERMEHALSDDCDSKSSQWLTSSDVAVVTALPNASNVNAAEALYETIERPQGSSCEFSGIHPSEFIDWVFLTKWVRDHMDAVTVQTKKLASELKAFTGEELLIRGKRYPFQE